MPKVLFIYNPNAGKGNIRKEISHIIERLSESGYEITAFPTKKKGDAKKYTSSHAQRFDLLVCAGGDGTFNEIACGMMKAEKKGNVPTVGYIPVGTVNDFAASLEIPKEIDEALDIILYGRERKFDVGSFCVGTDNTLYSYFTYVAAFGAFTEVSYTTSQEFKNLVGKMAYFFEGIKSIQKIRPHHLKISYNGTIIEDDFIFGMVANSKSVGGFKGITGPEVYLDDGEFDAIFVKAPKSAFDLQNIINSFITLNVNTESICHFHSSEIMIEAEDSLQWTLDGESGGSHGKVLINNYKQAIKVKVKEGKINENR